MWCQSFRSCSLSMFAVINVRSIDVRSIDVFVILITDHRTLNWSKSSSFIFTQHLYFSLDSLVSSKLIFFRSFSKATPGNCVNTESNCCQTLIKKWPFFWPSQLYSSECHHCFFLFSPSWSIWSVLGWLLFNSFLKKRLFLDFYSRILGLSF